MNSYGDEMKMMTVECDDLHGMKTKTNDTHNSLNSKAKPKQCDCNITIFEQYCCDLLTATAQLTLARLFGVFHTPQLTWLYWRESFARRKREVVYGRGRSAHASPQQHFSRWEYGSCTMYSNRTTFTTCTLSGPTHVHQIEIEQGTR